MLPTVSVPEDAQPRSRCARAGHKRLGHVGVCRFVPLVLGATKFDFFGSAGVQNSYPGYQFNMLPGYAVIDTVSQEVRAHACCAGPLTVRTNLKLLA